MDFPAVGVGRCRDQLRSPGESGDPLGAPAAAQEGGEPIAPDAGLLVSLPLGLLAHLGIDPLHDGAVSVSTQGISQTLHLDGVGRGVDRTVTGGEAATEVGESTR